MTTATLKTLAEMTIEELTSLKDATYAAYREVERARHEMSEGDPRWPDLHDSRQATWLQYHRIDDELARRGA